MVKLKDSILPEEIILNKILFIRGKKVMIDKDLADLYNVSTKRLNEQVKRNNKRFPKDFMFQLTQNEKDEVVANCDHLSTLKYSPNLPYAFTEHGAVMLASVVNSIKAIEANIQIIRVFNKMREALFSYKDVLLKLEQLEQQTLEHTSDIRIIFDYLKQLLTPAEQRSRRRIGFRRKDEDL
jgi:exosome complex RNA-binding protein Csl4